MGILLIRGGLVIDPSSNVKDITNVVIENGIVCAIGSCNNITPDKVIEAQGLIVAPGLVDMHVHLRDFGQSYKEDFFSCSQAAIAGGVTSLLCMPNTEPKVVDNPQMVDQIKKKANRSATRIYVAAAATLNLVSNDQCDYIALAKAGAIAITNDGNPIQKTETLRMVMKNGVDLKLLCHCGGADRTDEGLPFEAEWRDVSRVIDAAREIDCSVHVCHVSTAQSLELIRCAKANKIKITCETAPHYVAFTKENLVSMDADYLMNPPLGTESDRIAIIEALRDGTIDVIATDHAPHAPYEKVDINIAPSGVIGLETSLAAIMTYSGLTIENIICLMSTNPAKILGIPAGTIVPGSYADLILIDSEMKWLVDVNKLYSKSKNAVFKGCELKGRVIKTIIGGNVVYDLHA